MKIFLLWFIRVLVLVVMFIAWDCWPKDGSLSRFCVGALAFGVYVILERADERHDCPHCIH